jgi:hypothetical protein
MHGFKQCQVQSMTELTTHERARRSSWHTDGDGREATGCGLPAFAGKIALVQRQLCAMLRQQSVCQRSRSIAEGGRKERGGLGPRQVAGRRSQVAASRSVCSYHGDACAWPTRPWSNITLPVLSRGARQGRTGTGRDGGTASTSKERISWSSDRENEQSAVRDDTVQARKRLRRLVRLRTTHNSTAQHSTAQHSTAQHSTAQHSTHESVGGGEVLGLDDVISRYSTGPRSSIHRSYCTAASSRYFCSCHMPHRERRASNHSAQTEKCRRRRRPWKPQAEGDASVPVRANTSNCPSTPMQSPEMSLCSRDLNAPQTHRTASHRIAPHRPHRMG